MGLLQGGWVARYVPDGVTRSVPDRVACSVPDRVMSYQKFLRVPHVPSLTGSQVLSLMGSQPHPFAQASSKPAGPEEASHPDASGGPGGPEVHEEPGQQEASSKSEEPGGQRLSLFADRSRKRLRRAEGRPRRTTTAGTESTSGDGLHCGPCWRFQRRGSRWFSARWWRSSRPTPSTTRRRGRRGPTACPARPAGGYLHPS